MGRRLYGREQKRFFWAHVADEVVTEIVAIVMSNYASAAAFGEERWGSWEAKDAIPHVRRADIETALSMLPVKFKPLNVRVEKKPNANGTAWHTEVICGSVVLTQSKTEGPDVAVREAVFRESLAADCRMNLWPEDVAEPSNDAEVLWACVVHGPSDKPGVPAYIRVVFPLDDGTFQTYVTLPVVSRREEIGEAVTRLRRAFEEEEA